MRQILIKTNSRSSTFNNHFKPISMNNTSALLGYFSYLHPSMPSVRAIESSQTLDCVEPNGHKTRKLLSLPSLELSPFQADDSRSYTALQKRLGAGAHSLGRVLVQIWQVNRGLQWETFRFHGIEETIIGIRCRKRHGCLNGKKHRNENRKETETGENRKPELAAGVY